MNTENATQILFRERINHALAILDYPLTMVCAPIGYGKTTSVKLALDKENVQSLWTSHFSISDKPALRLFSEHLCKSFFGEDQDSQSKIHAFCELDVAMQITTIANFQAEFSFATPHVLVIDNFYCVGDPDTFNLLSALVELEIPNFHLVVITRTSSPFDISHLIRLCKIIRADTLAFTYDELCGYYNLIGFYANESIIKNVYDYTGGWISAIYLVTNGLKNGLGVKDVAALHTMLENNLFNHIDDDTKKLLERLNLLNDFTERKAEFTIGSGTGESIRNFQKQVSFVQYDEKMKRYKLHPILHDYLNRIETIPQAEKNAIYSKLAIWYLNNREYFQAITTYYEIGRIEDALTIINDFETPLLNFIEGRELLPLFQSIGYEQRFKYPFAFMYYCNVLTLSGNKQMIQEGNTLLEDLRIYFERNNLLPRRKRDKILGDVHVCSIFGAFNDIQKVVFHVNEAKRLLDGAYSTKIDRHASVSFGVPQLIYSYYIKSGGFKSIAELLAENFETFADITNGCSTGSTYLVNAEYSLETFDMENAELCALKAMHRATTKEQLSIEASAIFIEIRIAISRGKVKEALEYLSELKEKIAKANSPILQTTYDMIEGYTYGLLGQLEKIPSWLSVGDMSKGVFIYQGLAFNYIVYGKALLLKGDYVKLDVLCESFIPFFKKFNNLLGLIHNHIHRSVAKFKIDGDEAGAEELMHAVRIAAPDNISMPFAENYKYLLPILNSIDITNEASPHFEYRSFVEKLMIRCREVQKKQQEQSKNTFTNVAGLSEREFKILVSLSLGHTRDEIAIELSVSVATIKKHISIIYQKLSARNRAAAIKTATELGIL